MQHINMQHSTAGPNRPRTRHPARPLTPCVHATQIWLTSPPTILARPTRNSPYTRTLSSVALRSKHDAHSANGDSLSAERDRLAKELEAANKARAMLEEQLAALRASNGEFNSERDGMLERIAALEVSWH